MLPEVGGHIFSQREAWITAVFLMGYGQHTGQEWWLANPADPSPDVVAITLTEAEKGNRVERLNVEIFEYEQHTAAEDLAGAIAQKLSGKAYPLDYRLVCCVHHHEGETFTPAEVAKQVTALNPHVGEVWLVASIAATSPNAYIVSQIYPDPPAAYLIDYAQQCSETRQVEILGPKRGLSKEATEFGWKVVELP